MLSVSTQENMKELYSGSATVRLPAVTRPVLRRGEKPPYKQYAATLREYGFLVITLEAPDTGALLEDIVQHLGIPHTHDDGGRTVWDIKQGGQSGKEALARSHGLNEFVLHTDCSYEEEIPSHFGLYVVEADRYGGGQNLLIDGLTLVQHLSDRSLEILQKQPFRVKVPPEFLKEKPYIEVCLIDEDLHVRYRREIIDLTMATSDQRQALAEFDELAHNTLVNRSLSLRKGQIFLLDNRRFLHARTEIKDPRRHLKRIRFNVELSQDTQRTSIF